MRLGRKTRPAWEYVAVVSLVGVVLWLSLALYAKRDGIFKGKLLMRELAFLRNHVMIHILTHKTLPASLTVLVQEAADPFGEPYHYNPRTGRCTSVSQGYENW